MSELPMRGHFRYLSFKTFPMTPRTPQCEVFCPLLSSSEHLGVPVDSQPPTFPSVRLHPHTWPKWGCDILYLSNSVHRFIISFGIDNLLDFDGRFFKNFSKMYFSQIQYLIAYPCNVSFMLQLM